MRGGSTRYYYDHPDGQQKPLGGDLAVALRRWSELHTQPLPTAPDAFCTIADQYEAHGLAGLAVKTQAEYRAALTRLRAVFKAAPMASIRPVHVGQMLHELRDTPVLARTCSRTRAGLTT